MSTDETICQYCNKKFSSKSNLTTHKKTAKYCQASQNEASSFKCEHCEKSLTTKQRLEEHLLICKFRQSSQLKLTYEEKINNLQALNDKLKDELLKKEQIIEKFYNKLFEFVKINKTPETVSQQMNSIIDEINVDIKDKRIKKLENICLSKKSRVIYPERNVIYLLTTDDHIKRRTYIIGKAKNLTTRLGTYNKTCDHSVVYYRECKNEDDMDMAESLILSKLRDYREQANRDRFILPDDKEIDFFTKMIDDCINFM